MRLLTFIYSLNETLIRTDLKAQIILFTIKLDLQLPKPREILLPLTELRKMKNTVQKTKKEN